MAEADAVNRFCQKKSTQFEVSFSPASTGFSCTFGIPGVQKVCHAAGSSKKNAQAAALKQMYDFLSRSGMLDQVLADGPATKKRKVAEKSPVLDQAAAYEPWSPPVIPARGMIPRGTVPPRAGLAAGLAAGPAPLRPGAVPGTSGTASVKPAAPQSPAAPVEDDAGNFTLAIARGHLNEHLKKWGQRTDIKVVADGPSHAPTFKAMLSFQVKGQRFNEMHHAGSKKQATNELALKVCRKLFARGLLPKYKRNSTKGTFFDNLKDSQYFESSSFGVGLPPHLKERLRNYLEQHSYEVHHDVSVPPGTVLWEASMPEEDDQEVGSIAALPWSSPEEGPPPWPEPKGEALPDTFAAAIGAEASANLPIASKFQEIIDTVAENQVSIIQGSTGSGKTTQVPQYILDSQDGHSKTIVVTQPRRLAAITVARRVAAERGEALGGSVGYAVRFDAVWPQRPGGICYMTSGLLLKRLHQRGLCGISHVIVDEVHERDLDNDVLLGLLRSALVVHPELKVVLMSATIDARKFQAFLRERSEHAPIPPVIAVQGHSYDVRCLFLEDIVEKMKWTPPPQKKEKEPAGAMNSCNPQEYSPNTVKALQLMPEQHIPLELARDLLKTLVSEGTVSHETGSVLVFLPTWAMMSSLSKLLQADTMLSRCKVIMLHSQVPKEAQMEAFQPAPEGMAKVILATNIAESSVTIDDVTCVIDSCKVKLTFFTETTRLSYHDVVFTGRHNLEQRKGRAGRTRPGLCFRLCTRRRFEEGLEDEVPPELTRMPLVGAALLVKSLELGDIAAVLSQCPDPPPETSVAHAIAELKLVRALDEQQNLTYLGRILARLPLDPHVGVALLLGHWLFGLGDVMATICAAMSFDEPFQFAESAGFLPWKIQEKYKGTHKNSDQFVLGLVHQEYARIMDTGGEAAAKRFCVQEGLHPAIMRQAYNASEQLRALLQSDALGGLAMGSLEDEEGTAAIALEQHRNYSAIRDWNSKEWCWGAVLLSLVTALPHLAVHQEKRHVWMAEDTIGAVYRGSINCCKNSYAPWLEAAAAFCAQRFHTFFLPRLSSRQDEPEDFELVEMVNQAIEDLEKSLLDSNARYAGCGLALLLVLGQRVLVANVGNCRAVMCTPPKPSGDGLAAPSPKDPWKIRLLVGGGPSGQALADVVKLERLRRLKEYAPLDFEGKPGDVLSGCSATAEELSAISDPRERALRRVAKAAHHFAALGFSATEAVTATVATVQKAVEDFERTVGKPDGTSLYTTALGRVKAAAKAVEAMISLDSFGTNQLAELCYVMDDEGGILSQKRAASILGVEPGCGEATAHAQVETRYRAVLSNLAGASPEGAASAWSIMGEVVDAAARPVAQLWAPPVENRAVAAARAMGLRDLKRPRKLVGLEIVSEVVHLEDNSTFCVMLLTEGMREVTEAQIADAITLHKGKPKAACLRIAHEAAKKKEAAEVKAVGAVAAYIDISDDYITEPDKAATKKLKTADGRSMPSAKPPSRIRIAHILLKCQPASGPAPSDPQARRQAPSDRTQADGEAQLLKLVEVLLAEYHKGPEAGASKRLSAKFAELAREHSDCKSATNGSLSDLGWINQGQHGKDFDAVAFELPVGGLSDIIVTQRGVHLLHRLA